MTKNVGPEDRVVRIVAALVLAAIIYFAPLTGVTAIVVGAIAAVLLVTGLIRTCPFYAATGIDTSVQEQPYSTSDDRAGI